MSVKFNQRYALWCDRVQAKNAFHRAIFLFQYLTRTINSPLEQLQLPCFAAIHRLNVIKKVV